MEERNEMNRRSLLLGVGATLGALAGAPVLAAGWDPDAGVTAPEDLMKEHGVLNRCLLIYEEGVRRLRDGHEISPETFGHTAALVKHFVEEYHEKNEEDFIFPVFEKHGKLVDLVSTLKTQHKAGRKVTAQIIALSKPDTFKAKDNQTRLIAAIEAFIRMYRPHESREDTVLFPALRTILNPKQVESLGERMEGNEQKVLGHEGFERSVDQVTQIEKALGILDLKQFTPHV
jgi:hemerythrin-like domain-containing protein